MKYCLCFSKIDFDNICEKNNWSDNNIPEDIAFISIVGTMYDEPKELHWFKTNHTNVLNLEFDDVTKESIMFLGKEYYGITKDQAISLVKFIEQNKGKNFYIHCKAGKSRSQAVVRYILDYYGKKYCYQESNDNPCLTPNIYVLAKLKEAGRLLGYDLGVCIDNLRDNLTVEKSEFFDGLGEDESYYLYTFGENDLGFKKVYYFLEGFDTPLIKLTFTNKKIKTFKDIEEFISYVTQYSPEKENP